jgi:hypothetical protein
LIVAFRGKFNRCLNRCPASFWISRGEPIQARHLLRDLFFKARNSPSPPVCC